MIAKIIPLAFNLACRNCEEFIPEPASGSQYWTVDEYAKRLETRNAEGIPTLCCPNCSQPNSLPPIRNPR